MQKNKVFLSFLFFLAVLFLVSTFAEASPTVVIYKSESCGHCNSYIKELKNLFAKENISNIQEKSILSDKAALQELDAFTREKKIPYELQGHMVTVINNLVLEGHIPLEAIEDLFKTYPGYTFPKLVLFQDSMDPLVIEYTLLEQGQKKECTTEKSLAFCREQGEEKVARERSFLLVVLLNALLAGIHPCTISVLLFFIALLFTLRKSRVSIMKAGLAYILGIFLAYLGIGMGIFKAITFVETPHFAAKIGAILVLALGLFNLLSYFLGARWSLGMPRFVKPTVANLLQRSTIPAVFLVGILVGVCSFGCTAGIYLSIISLLLIKAKYVQGVFYLLLYNLMFIVPLILILMVAVNKRIVRKIERLEVTKSKYVKLISGIVMIIFAFIIFWITVG